MKVARLRIRRKSQLLPVDANAPAVAKRRAADARARIETGLMELRAVQRVDGLPILDRLQSLTLDGFIKWVGVGNDTLYKTHADLRDSITQELSRLRTIHAASARGSRTKKKR